MSAVAQVWVTGAHGFIGRHVARAAARRGSTVVGLGHGTWGDAEMGRWGVDGWWNGEIDAPNLDAIHAKRGAPEVIIHLAGGSSVGASLAQPFEDFQRTVGTTARLLDWIRLKAPRAKLVLVSSAAVYGAAHSGPIPEGAALDPMSPYGHHKAAMELLARSSARSFGLEVVVVRLFSIYGPGLRKQLLWDLLNRLEGGEDPVIVGGTGAERRDWVHVEAAADLLLRAVPHASVAAPCCNGGTGVGTALSDVTASILRHWGRGRAAFSGVSRPGDPVSLVAAPGRLGAAMGLPLDEGIRGVVEWFRGRDQRE